MLQSKIDALEQQGIEFLQRRWKLIVVLVWVVICGWFIFQKWNEIRFFGLPDTDDNMRIMQVRALLHGQGWYDLRNYRMNPPFGANIHWSRLVDLPIAGLILGLRPFLGGAGAERWAVAIAPLLPYLLLLFSLAVTARRLIAPLAYPLALLAIFFAGSTNGMFMPERIDHHNWQLALLALSMAGIADAKRVRGGLVLGISSALSLAIGLEMIIYLALAGAAMVLFWVDEREEAERLRAYALSMSGGIAFCYLVFGSYDNSGPVCDALSPVFVSDALLGSALMYALAWLSPADWKRRLALAVGAGLIIAGFHASVWPQCLQKPEHISPEAQRLWMSYVKEARPVYRHGWRITTLMVALPITGLAGLAALAWLRRSDRSLLRRIIGVATPCLIASLLLLWQTRTGPAAEMLAAVGAAALAWTLWPIFWKSKYPWLRVSGAVVALLVAIGAAVPAVLDLIPEKPSTPYQSSIGRANSLCGSLWGLHPIALEPKGLVFTFVDLGPRLITLTHHDAIAGPYHRNYQQIVDIMKAWRGSADQAHQIISTKYHSTYVLSCPNSSTTTIFMSETPKGFYGQLQRGQVPKWLQPVELPKDSPFKMWRVVG
ncbi:MAG TPA: AcrB/AcrD/AcrF family protein [Sphingomicrobium sp.]|nr:AcrB/AcrD/AcrF family protein [Sphingomicrobium sp.]